MPAAGGALHRSACWLPPTDVGRDDDAVAEPSAADLAGGVA